MGRSGRNSTTRARFLLASTTSWCLVESSILTSGAHPSVLGMPTISYHMISYETWQEKCQSYDSTPRYQGCLADSLVHDVTWVRSLTTLARNEIPDAHGQIDFRSATNMNVGMLASGRAGESWHIGSGAWRISVVQDAPTSDSACRRRHSPSLRPEVHHARAPILRQEGSSAPPRAGLPVIGGAAGINRRATPNTSAPPRSCCDRRDGAA